jgi:RHS repeat-associated protein
LARDGVKAAEIATSRQLGRDVRRFVGSASVALDGSGLPTASQLYAPYGGMRYQNGAMPTDYGFTGQRNDATTGLDYYGARYYDPTIGQFTSTDTMLAGGLNRYSYVGGNPISRTDPSGQMSVGFEHVGIEGGESSIDLANPVPGAGGGGGIPLPDPGPLLNWVLGGALAVEGVLGELTTIPTAKAPGYTPTAGGVDDSDYWNIRTAPHSSPLASRPGGGTHSGGGSGGHGGGGGSGTSADTPQTQTGGGSAGGTFGGGGGAAPASPEDDGCGCGQIPQGLTQEQFAWLSSTVRAGTARIGSNDIVVQGSRAAFTAEAGSDIDLAIRVSPEQFDELIAERFGTPNPGSAKFRTMEHAIATGKIQAGELGLHGFRNMLASQLGIPVDLSAIRIGGSFDNGEMIPLC